MKRIINTTEVVGTIDLPEECEVCASADASYDSDAQLVTIQLDCFLRTTDVRTKERHPAASWLPASETVKDKVAQEEASEMAREIFHRWVRKVREATPSLHSPSI